MMTVSPTVADTCELEGTPFEVAINSILPVKVELSAAVSCRVILVPISQLSVITLTVIDCLESGLVFASRSTQ